MIEAQRATLVEWIAVDLWRQKMRDDPRRIDRRACLSGSGPEMKRDRDYQRTARSKATEELAQRLSVVRDVLQHVERADDIERSVGKCQAGHVFVAHASRIGCATQCAVA